MDGLFFELPVGLQMSGEVHKNVELLSTNGVAEKVFVKKIADKPFTWQGNVVSIATKRVGDFEIGSECRKKYLEDGSVTIPMPVRKLTMADVNSMLVEIHRRCWVSFIPKQEIVCRYCGKRLTADIDLDKIVLLPAQQEKLENIQDFSQVIVNLKHGFKPVALAKFTEKEEYAGITETLYNRFVFRPPLLEDAIKNEKYFDDSILFWRRIAMDCLVAIQKVDKNDVVVDTLPIEFHTYYGLKIFNEYLSGVDLKSIRDSLQEDLPTLPFAYYEECVCGREIPMTMDVSNFFSE